MLPWWLLLFRAAALAAAAELVPLVPLDAASCLSLFRLRLANVPAMAEVAWLLAAVTDDDDDEDVADADAGAAFTAFLSLVGGVPLPGVAALLWWFAMDGRETNKHIAIV